MNKRSFVGAKSRFYVHALYGGKLHFTGMCVWNANSLRIVYDAIEAQLFGPLSKGRFFVARSDATAQAPERQSYVPRAMVFRPVVQTTKRQSFVVRYERRDDFSELSETLETLESMF